MSATVFGPALDEYSAAGYSTIWIGIAVVGGMGASLSLMRQGYFNWQKNNEDTRGDSFFRASKPSTLSLLGLNSVVVCLAKLGEKTLPGITWMHFRNISNLWLFCLCSFAFLSFYTLFILSLGGATLRQPTAIFSYDAIQRANCRYARFCDRLSNFCIVPTFLSSALRGVLVLAAASALAIFLFYSPNSPLIPIALLLASFITASAGFKQRAICVSTVALVNTALLLVCFINVPRH